MKKLIDYLTAAGDPVKATSRIAGIGASLVILAAMALSYSALYDLFLSIGLFGPGLAWLFPLLFDFAEITAAIIVLSAKLQGEDDRLAWRAVLIITGLGVVANLAHSIFAWYSAEINTAQAILGVLFTSLLPVSVALVTHLLKAVITRSLQRDTSIKTLKNLADDLQRLAQQLEVVKADHQRETKEVEALKAEKSSLELSLEELKIERRKAAKGDFIASQVERQAYQLDGLIAGGMTLRAACELVGISENTGRSRLQNLNGDSLSKKGS